MDAPIAPPTAAPVITLLAHWWSVSPTARRKRGSRRGDGQFWGVCRRSWSVLEEEI